MLTLNVSLCSFTQYRWGFSALMSGCDGKWMNKEVGIPLFTSGFLTHTKVLVSSHFTHFLNFDCKYR